MLCGRMYGWSKMMPTPSTPDKSLPSPSTQTAACPVAPPSARAVSVYWSVLRPPSQRFSQQGLCTRHLGPCGTYAEKYVGQTQGFDQLAQPKPSTTATCYCGFCNHAGATNSCTQCSKVSYYACLSAYHYNPC